MKTFLTMLVLLPAAAGLGQSTTVDSANEKIRIQTELQQLEWDQQQRDIDKQNADMRQRRKDAEQNARMANLENSVDALQYDLRNPTSEEVQLMQEQWKSAHPFSLSTEMPDFAYQQIKVPHNRQVQYLQQINPQPIYVRDRVISSQPVRPARVVPSPQPSPVAPVRTEPSAPNPSSIALRKLSDGQVMAVIGSKPMKFKNEAAAQAYIDTLKH